jgi:hypothetical protein
MNNSWDFIDILFFWFLLTTAVVVGNLLSSLLGAW